jgi:hypothetical protein
VTIAAELADLQRRHRALDEEIADAVSYYSNEDLMIGELKRRRLHIKAEIERLRATTNHYTMIEKSA